MEISKNAPAVLPDIYAVDDKLNFGPYAKTFADIILNPNTETPLTIGIFGSWGSGKTSLMKMIEARLKSDEEGAAQSTAPVRKTFTLWFNAWLYSKETTLWRALVMQVISGVQAISDLDQAAKGELDALANQLYRAIGPSEPGDLSIKAADLLAADNTAGAELRLNLRHGLDLLENIAAARQQGAEAAAKALRDQVRQATAALERERIESLDKFQKQFQDLIEKYVLPRGFMVIFVDDLDRCLPEKAVEVLEAIKLFLDVPGCIFILGIDRDVIERGIRLRYGELGGAGEREAVQLQVDGEAIKVGAASYRNFMQELDVEESDTIDGERYLEKIIQIPFVLPPISPQAMGRFVAQLTPNLPDPRCGLVFVRGLEPNPRQVKRTLNIFTLLWTLAQNQPYLAERISPVRLAKLVILQQRHANLYDKLRQDPARLIAWERACRIRRNRDEYIAWAAAERVDESWPSELEAYDNDKLPALELLLTMHSLTGEDAQNANFVDMTPDEVYELIFLAHTAEGSAERPVQQEPVSKGRGEPTPKDVEIAATPFSVPQPSGPILLHRLVRLSDQEAGFIAQRALGEAAGLANVLQSREAGDFALEQLAEAGSNFTRQLQLGSDQLDELAGQPRAVQALFGGPEALLMARLPWEMGIRSMSKVVSFDEFWGARHIIERPLSPGLGQRLPAALTLSNRPPRVGLVLDWSINASPAMELFNAWNSQGRVQLRPIEEPDAFRQCLLENWADMYVIYGRGKKEVGESRIAIGKGYYFSAREILAWVEKTPSENQETLIKLRETLHARFSEEDLRTLCFDLNIDYDVLPAEGKSGKDRELIAYLVRRGRISELIDYIRKMRPDISLDEIAQEARPTSERPPVLFYFALQGDARQDLDWSGWPAAMEQLGAAGFIAPLIYTPGPWPLELMRHFFDEFLDGKPVGKALRDARCKLFEETRNPLGLVYAHFGPPELQLSQAEEED